ncbi:hypothetical protein PR048_023545 [Dryococelus australis]|uniref:Uncharacterized protein n=1 Tax=Dryococelus australis TaxID=614101 RepID=A0ABQ9GUH1_9NEOP|nr:hypothetical protein PR048_023545 [Dryococelus australis]
MVGSPLKVSQRRVVDGKTALQFSDLRVEATREKMRMSRSASELKCYAVQLVLGLEADSCRGCNFVGLALFPIGCYKTSVVSGLSFSSCELRIHHKDGLDSAVVVGLQGKVLQQDVEMTGKLADSTSELANICALHRVTSLLYSNICRGDPGLVPGRSLQIFTRGNQTGRCHWLAGFLGDLLFPPPLHSGVAPYSPHFNSLLMERCRNEGAEETGYPRENSPTNHIVRHDSHMRESGVTGRGPCNFEVYSPHDENTARQFGALRLVAMLHLMCVSLSPQSPPRFSPSNAEKSPGLADTGFYVCHKWPISGPQGACQQLADGIWFTYVRPEAESHWSTAATHGPLMVLTCLGFIWLRRIGPLVGRLHFATWVLSEQRPRCGQLQQDVGHKHLRRHRKISRSTDVANTLACTRWYSVFHVRGGVQQVRLCIHISPANHIATRGQRNTNCFPTSGTIPHTYVCPVKASASVHQLPATVVYRARLLGIRVGTVGDVAGGGQLFYPFTTALRRPEPRPDNGSSDGDEIPFISMPQQFLIVTTPTRIKKKTSRNICFVVDIFLTVREGKHGASLVRILFKGVAVKNILEKCSVLQTGGEFDEFCVTAGNLRRAVRVDYTARVHALSTSSCDRWNSRR